MTLCGVVCSSMRQVWVCVSLGTLICVSQASDGFQVIIFLPSILLRVLVVSAHIRNLETFSDLVRETPTYCGICHEMQFANVPKHVVVVEQMNKQKQKPVSVSREHYASLWSWMDYWTGLQLQGPTVRVAQLRAPIWRDQLISSGTLKRKRKHRPRVTTKR